MTAEPLFLRMARNSAWANGRLLTAAMELSQNDFFATRTGFFPSLQKTFGHILQVDQFYLDALTDGGQGRAIFQRMTPQTARAMRTEQANTDAEIMAFCDSPIDPEATVTIDWTGGPATERVEAILLHLFQHQIHHRGQAHAMMSGTHVPPPQLDEFYPEFQRPEDAQLYWSINPRPDPIAKRSPPPQTGDS